MKAARDRLVLLLLTAPAWAHKPSDAHLRLDVHGDRVTGRLDIAVRDLEGARARSTTATATITWGELQAAAPRIATYIEHRVAVAADGTPCALELGTAKLVDLSDGAYWACRSTPRARARRTRSTSRTSCCSISTRSTAGSSTSTARP